MAWGKGILPFPFHGWNIFSYLSDQFSKGDCHNSSHFPPLESGQPWDLLEPDGCGGNDGAWPQRLGYKRQCDSALRNWTNHLGAMPSQESSCLPQVLLGGRSHTSAVKWTHGGARHQPEEGEKPGQLLAPPGPAAIRLQSPRASKPEPPYSPCKFLVPRNHLRPWSVCWYFKPLNLGSNLLGSKWTCTGEYE